MKKLILRIVTVILAFFAGIGGMSYVTRMGNRDMTAEMAQATLPVAYAEWNGQLYNEMHGYLDAMDGSYMKDSLIGLPEDHTLHLAVEKYNAQIEGISYEVRSLDAARLIEGQEMVQTQDDGRYLRVSLEIKDLLERGEPYLFVLKVRTKDHGDVSFYSQLEYLGENHVQECMDFIDEFHRVTVEKDTESSYLNYLEPNGTMDGKSLGYVNIHSRSGPVTWGDMQVEQITDSMIRFTELDYSTDTVSAVLSYQLQNTQTKETYEVEEAVRVRYTSSRMYLLAYERTADKIFEPGGQLVEEQSILFGIQSQGLNYRKNEEENIIGFVQQGQLWCYDLSQNRLSLVYGFEDGDDQRGYYNAHDFRILRVDDSGSMDFLVYGYMNRGNYEGRCGVLLCQYDALLNTVDEQVFIPSDRPYQIVKEELGALAVENESKKAWIAYQDQVLQIDLTTCTVRILAENVREGQLKVSQDGTLAAWTSESMDQISLLNTKSGVINAIEASEGELLQALGFMEEDFIYGEIHGSQVIVDQGGQQIYPMYRVVIRDHAGREVREFDYEAKGKYVTEVSIVENRIDLTCIQLTGAGSYAEALPEPITYTSEPVEEKLQLKVVYDEIKRNEYELAYEGTIKSGSLKHPRVKLVVAEESRVLQLEEKEEQSYFAYGFYGEATKYHHLAEAVTDANDRMGTVWRGAECWWSRGGRKTRTQLDGFAELEQTESGGSAVAQSLQLLLRQKQIYTEVQTELDAGKAVWEICEEAFGEDCCLLSGCTLDMTLYYVSGGAPVLGLTQDGAVLVTGYDSLNIYCVVSGQTTVQKMGRKDAAAMFESAGNLFFTYLK